MSAASVPTPIELRLYGLEGIAKTQDRAIEDTRERQHAHDIAIGNQGLTLATHSEILKSHTEALSGLGDNVGRLMWTLVGTALTIATSAIGVSLALVLTGGPS